MELDRLEVVFDGDLTPFEEKMARFESKLNSVMGRVSSSADKTTNGFEKNFNDFKGFDKFNQQLDKLNSNLEKQFSKMNQNADKQGSEIGNSLSTGISKGTVKTTKDVQSAIDKINLKMQQARAAQDKLGQLKSNRSGAEVTGNGKAAASFNDKIAQTQIKMNKAQQEAQAIARSLKTEYDAIPGSLSLIEAKMAANEQHIEAMRAKVKALNAEMRSQMKDTGGFNETKLAPTPKSTKTAGAISSTTAKMDKAIADNDRLAQVYAKLEDRSKQLKSGLERVNTELGKAPSKIRMVANGMSSLSGSSNKANGFLSKIRNSITQSSGIFNKFKNIAGSSIGKLGSLFNRQSKQITNATSRMSKDTGAFGQSIRYLLPSIIVYQLIGNAIRSLSGGLFSALKTNSQFSSSLNQIKANLLTAFYPIYQAILPAINAMMAGLAKLTGYLASFISMLFGVDVSDSFNGAQGLYDDAQALEDTGDAADGAKEKVKKLKQLLMGFDEINTLQFDDDDEEDDNKKDPKPDGPGAIDWGAAKVPETPKWLEDFAKKFKDIMSKLFDPIKKAWDAQGKKIMDAFKRALSEVGKLAESIGKSFMEVWTNGTGQRFVENLLILLADALNIIADIAQAFRIAWDENGRGTALIQQIFDALNRWLELLHDIASSFREVWNNGTGVETARQILDFFTNIFHLLESIGTAFQNAWNEDNNGTKAIQAIFDALNSVLNLINIIITSFDSAFSSGIGEAILGNIINIVENVGRTISNLANNFSEAWSNAGTGESIFNTILTVINNVAGTINSMTSATAAWAQELNFSPLLTSIDGLLKSIEPVTKTIFDGLDWAYQNLLLPLASFTIEDVLPRFIDTLKNAIDIFNGVLETLKPLGKWLWEEFLKPLAEWTGEKFLEAFDILNGYLKDFGNWIKDHKGIVEGFVIVLGSFALAWEAVNIALGIWNGLALVGAGLTTALTTAIGVLTSPVALVVVAIGSLIAIGVLLWKNWDTVKEKAGQLVKWLGEKWDAIKKATSEVFTGIWTKIKEVFSNIVEGAKEKINTFKENLVNGFQTAKTKAIEVVSGIKDKITEFFSNIIQGAKDLPGKIKEGLSNGIDAISSVVKNIANKLVEPIEGAVNGIIGGVNWVLDAVHSKTQLSKWEAPVFYANGTNYHQGGPAVVNDGSGSNWQEMYRLPSGQVGVFPKKKNLLVNLPRGSQVLPGNLSAKILPNYAGGIFNTFKDFFSNGFDKAKGIASDVWDVISDPSALVDKAMDMFANFSNILEPMWSMATSVLSSVKDSVVDMVVDKINDFTGFADGGIVDKYGWYKLAEGNHSEMILPLTKPQRAFQLINEALDFMGMPDLTLPDVFRDTSDGYSGSYSKAEASKGLKISGNSLSGLNEGLLSSLGSSIAEAIITALSSLGIANGGGDPLEIILQVDSDNFGKVTINAINKVTQKTGVFPLTI